jgi:hypothetical protein
MLAAFKLAGYFAAHAIWSVSEEESFVPMFAYEGESGKGFQRLVYEDFHDAVLLGRKKLESNELDANDAALLFDGRISIEDKKLDAVIIEIRTYFSFWSQATVAIPYTRIATGQFKVHSPELLLWNQCEDFDPDMCLQFFFDGVEEHEEGQAVWSKCFSRTI